MKNKVAVVPDIIPYGTTILYPTETVYGLGCRFDDKKALQDLYALKGRSTKVPVALIAETSAWVLQHFEVPSIGQELMANHWPGPLAMLLKPKNPRLFEAVAHEGFVGIRVSGSAVSRQLAKACGGAVVSTSANLSGEPTPLNWRDCPSSLLGSVGLVVDGGTLESALPSTLIRFSDDGQAIEVLRQGSVVVSECPL